MSEDIILRAFNLSKTFRSKGDGGVVALNNVNMTLYRQEAVGLIGKSGEGKSTMARILTGAIPPDSGELYFDGDSLIDNKGVYRRRIGRAIQIIAQQPYASLDPSQRVRDALNEALKVAGRRVGKFDAEELISKVALKSDILDRLPSQLSGGEAQRVILARALAVNPRIIIADEATSMLDIPSQAQIIAILRQLIEEEKVAVLFISHDLELVKAFTKRIYSLEKGKLSLLNGGVL